MIRCKTSIRQDSAKFAISTLVPFPALCAFPLPLQLRVFPAWSLAGQPSIVSLIRILNSPWPVWLSWLEHRPINWKVAVSIASQGTCLGCGFVPSHGVRGNQSLFLGIRVSLPLSPSLQNQWACSWVRIKKFKLKYFLKNLKLLHSMFSWHRPVAQIAKFW